MLVTYAQIQEALGRLLQRDDLAGHIPDFITMGESRLNSLIRVAQMEASAPIVLTDGAGSLPDDYLAYRRVYAGSPVVSLEAADPDWAIHKYPAISASPPRHFYIMGTSIYTKPVSSSDLTLDYYQMIPPLEANTAGNWLTNRAPQLYIYASALESAPFIDDDARLEIWGKLLERSVAELHESDGTARYANIAGRIRGATP